MSDIIGDGNPGTEEKPHGPALTNKNPLLTSILDTCETIRILQEQGRLPAEAVAHAKGILALRLDKVGFGISVTQGYGLIIARLSEHPNGWSAPLPVKLDGFSFGAVMGYKEQHSLICLKNDKDIMAFKAEKRAMKIGMDFGVDLGGKVNKNAAVDSQAGVQSTDSQSSKTQAFTISKGFLVDVSLNGTSVEPDVDDIELCYGTNVSSAEILQGRITAPKETQLLYRALKAVEDKYSAPIGAPVTVTAV